MLKRIVLRNADDDNWLQFSNPVDVIDIYQINQVLPAIASLEARVNEENLYAVGFISYEASPAFDAACVVKFDAGFPMLRFGLFEQAVVLEALDGAQPEEELNWQMDSAPAYYKGKIADIKSRIHAGDTYQVNFTVRQHAKGVQSAWSLFRQLGAESPFAAYIECEDWSICSASPELFFELDGDTLHTRPMKGTASRGATLREDEEQKSWLRNSEKNRAENVMIVDMIRNDLGRIARAGSVSTSNLFRVETYPTVLQMTSTVSAKTDSSVAEILKALFPCASITGAPKINTMQIIAKLEDSPRRIYTGSIGYIAPNRKAWFNVAIRTALVNNKTGHVCYGTGGGIVWDSDANEEFAEVNIKSHILGNPQKRSYFQILETLLWRDGEYYLRERHILRMLKSAHYFGFRINNESIENAMDELAKTLPHKACKVRLLLHEGGRFFSEYLELADDTRHTVNVMLARYPVDASSPWLRHKTTIRHIYDEAHANRPEAEDVLLWNNDGFITESSIANVVMKVGDKWITPSLASGLLAGTQRADLLEKQEITEGNVQTKQLRNVTSISLINSVRKWTEAKLLLLYD